MTAIESIKVVVDFSSITLLFYSASVERRFKPGVLFFCNSTLDSWLEVILVITDSFEIKSEDITGAVELSKTLVAWTGHSLKVLSTNITVFFYNVSS